MNSIYLLCVLSFLNCTQLFSQEQTKRYLQPFSKIHIQGDLFVELKKDTSEALVIKWTEGLNASEIESEISDNQLIIKSKIDLKNKIKVQLIVYYKDLNEIRTSSGADVRCDDTLKVSPIDFFINTNSIAYFKVINDKVSVSATSGGLLVLSGKTKKMDAKLISGATLDAFKLECLNAQVDAGSGSKIKVIAIENIDASATMGGFISVMGNPQKKNISKSLGGKVEIIK